MADEPKEVKEVKVTPVVESLMGLRFSKCPWCLAPKLSSNKDRTNFRCGCSISHDNKLLSECSLLVTRRNKKERTHKNDKEK